MKKVLLSLIGFAIISVVYVQNLKSNSNGAPGNYTGSNGIDCSDCHGGNSVNDGNGFVRATMLDKNNNVVSSYIPGQKYTFGVKVKGKSASAWGFASAFKASSGLVGTLAALSSNSKTKSTYVTHSKASSDTFAFTWTAPAKGTGNVTLYLSGNAANGDGSDGGDNIYTTTKALTEGTATSIENSINLNDNIKVFSSSNGALNVNIDSKIKGINYSIINLNGQVLQTNLITSGNQILNISNTLIGQVVLIYINTDFGIYCKKVILN